MNTPKVSLIGRPNVGKSTLFNRLLSKRQAVTADVAGTTRDRLMREMSYKGKAFTLIDMAGLEPSLSNGTEIDRAAQAQVKQGLEDADVLIWVADGKIGTTGQDARLAKTLRELKKPVIIAVNKVDNDARENIIYEFRQYGFDDVIALSALHGRGKEELLNAIWEYLPEGVVGEVVDPNRELGLAIVGRPNVGKSTLLNTMTGTERSIVSSVSGTTRDAVDTVVDAKQIFDKIFTKFSYVRLIDTAGIRRRGKMGHEIEAWSVVRTFDSIDQSDITLLLIDATDDLSHQDLVVADKVVDAGKGFIILVNKWDLVLEKKSIVFGTKEDDKLREWYLEGMRNKAPFLHFAPVMFVSAKTGFNLEYLGRIINEVYIAWSRTFSPEDLAVVAANMARNPRLKNVMGVVMPHSKPPVFHVKIEGKKLPHFSSIRFSENILRDMLDIGPTPIKVWMETSIQKR